MGLARALSTVGACFLIAITSRPLLAINLDNYSTMDYAHTVTRSYSYAVSMTVTTGHCGLGAVVGTPPSLLPSYREGFGSVHQGALFVPVDIPSSNAQSTTATLTVRVYGNRNCEFNAPVVLAGATSTVTTMALGSGVSQSGARHSSIGVTVIGDVYFLRDISRRANLQASDSASTGALVNSAVISTLRMPYSSTQEMLADRGWNSQGLLVASTNGLRSVARTERAALDSHVNTLRVHDYLSDFGLNSYDDMGSSMYSFVELYYPFTDLNLCGRNIPAGSSLNAYWDGRRVAYTTLPENRAPGASFSAAHDVVSHEWAHAVINRYSQLRYRREPGALNEAFADWMGVAAEWEAGEKNWTMGEGALVVRSISSPNTSLNPSPDTYKGRYWRAAGADSLADDFCQPTLCNDWCGVHINSGVPNKMFHLLSVGGIHNDVTVTGLGVSTAIRIAMRAQRFYWNASSDFASGRNGMEQAAATYGAEAVRAVRNAWGAVGVGLPAPPEPVVAPPEPVVAPPEPVVAPPEPVRKGSSGCAVLPRTAFFLPDVSLLCALLFAALRFRRDYSGKSSSNRSRAALS